MATARKRKPAGKKPKAKSKSTQLARSASAPNPNDRGISYLTISTRQAGVWVTEDTALTLGAVWACVRVITEGLCCLPWNVFEHRRDGGRSPQPDDPADWVISMQANPETPAFQFREMMLANAMIWGNSYAEIERDVAGRPLWLWQITPDRVEVKRELETGRLIYDVKNPRGPNTILYPDDVFHLRGLGFDGLVGYSVVRMAARTLGIGIALDEGACGFFANDSTPGGILKHSGRLSPEAKKNLKEDWRREHASPHRRRTMAVLEEGMDWKQIGIPPEDAQLLEQRQFTPAEICRFFRVQPHKVMDLTHATFSNIEEQNLEHVSDSLLPWATRLEQEADIKLFGRTNRGRRFTRHNFMALLRGNTAARGTYYGGLFDRGVLCVNDILEMEDRNPIGPDGDKRFVPLNMQLLEDAGEEPPEPPAPPEPAGDGNDPSNSTEDDKVDEDGEIMDQAFKPIFQDACLRILKREQHRARDAMKRKSPEAFGAEHEGYVRDALIPAAKTYSTAIARREPAGLEAAVALLAAQHMQELAGRAAALANDPGSIKLWEQLAEPMAARMLAAVKAAVEASRVKKSAA